MLLYLISGRRNFRFSGEDMECPNSDGKLCSIPDTAEGSLKLISIKDAEGTFVWDYRKDVCASYSNISDTKGYRKQCREQYNSCTQGIWVQHGCATLWVSLAYLLT